MGAAVSSIGSTAKIPVWALTREGDLLPARPALVISGNRRSDPDGGARRRRSGIPRGDPLHLGGIATPGWREGLQALQVLLSRPCLSYHLAHGPFLR